MDFNYVILIATVIKISFHYGLFFFRNPNFPVKETIFEKDKFSDIDWPEYDLKKQQYLQIGN